LVGDPIVSYLAVLVLAMGTTLAHMLRADADTAADAPDSRSAGPASPWSLAWSPEDHGGPDHSAGPRKPAATGPPAGTRPVPGQDQRVAGRPARPGRPETGHARLVAARLAAEGKLVSRRAVRRDGARGFNQALNALAREINAGHADRASPARG
jgi:hypothetical protein